MFERKRRGDLKKTEKYKILEQKYNVKSKGLGIVLEELKQCLQAKSIKIKRYNQRIEQYKINRLFHQDQKRVYQQLNGKVNMMLNLMLMKVYDFGVISGIAKYIIERMLTG